MLFKHFHDEIRIHASATKGTQVVKAEAFWSKNMINAGKIEYFLENQFDYQYFQIDSISGIITTQLKINRSIGDVYNVSHLIRNILKHSLGKLWTDCV